MRGQEGVAALLVVIRARDDSHSYRFACENAGQLVAGDLVRTGGEIESIELSDDRRPVPGLRHVVPTAAG